MLRNLPTSSFVPAILEKIALGTHTAQKAPDYKLPKGLTLPDEQGRAFRIAVALWKKFSADRARRDIPPAVSPSAWPSSAPPTAPSRPMITAAPCTTSSPAVSTALAILRLLSQQEGNTRSHQVVAGRTQFDRDLSDYVFFT
ncbi:MAG: hypothetical protein LBS59_03730 [Puniceicoccales bacterium]|jgi:hypothetical protein|nr:hypothetical protein [Puniceicoccales bacterium]